MEGIVLVLTDKDGKKKNKKYRMKLLDSKLYRFVLPDNISLLNKVVHSSTAKTDAASDAAKAKDMIDMRQATQVSWFPNDIDKKGIEVLLESKNIMRLQPSAKMEEW